MKTPAKSTTIYTGTLGDSPVGPLIFAATDAGLCGLYLKDQKHMPDTSAWITDEPRFDALRTQLASYFSGQEAAFPAGLTFVKGTPFQRQVWDALLGIPPGQTWTYAQLAEKVGSPRAVRAVGAAVGRNPLSIIVPCHRVVGSNGSLTGYAGGVDRKRWFLDHEQKSFTSPKQPM